jgi:hypothetical protein
MKQILTLLTVLVLAPLAALHGANALKPSGKPWVTVGGDGKLSYQSTSNGDRILDFSHAGYGGGGVRLPVVPVRKEVAPSGGDDSASIQAAIDAVAALPLTDGFRGAVLLKPGIFHSAKPLTISNDGVVLRGAGAGKDGTVIEMTGDPHVCVTLTGERLRFPKEDAAASIPITDDYVPSGALSFTVKDATGLLAGDTLLIRRPATAKWIHYMGMDTLVRNGKPQTWMKADSLITAERTIQAIQGNRIMLSVPLTDAIDARFLAPGSAVAVKTTVPRRLVNCGVESLRINSPPPSGTLAEKNNSAAALDRCEDCWLKDIAMHDTLENVRVLAGARRITLEGVHAVHTATVAKGAGYPADFLIIGSQVLLNRCSSAGDGSFYVGTLNTSATLNVALNCQFRGTGSIQPHMHWSTGLLIDSCQLPDGRIEFINRNTAGSGHGWAIGWAVAWNCTAKTLDVQQPPGAINWCIGCTGKLKESSASTGPWLSSPGARTLPSSLYLAQLQDRLGKSALTNIGY